MYVYQVFSSYFGICVHLAYDWHRRPSHTRSIPFHEPLAWQPCWNVLGVMLPRVWVRCLMVGVLFCSSFVHLHNTFRTWVQVILVVVLGRFSSSNKKRFQQKTNHHRQPANNSNRNSATSTMMIQHSTAPSSTCTEMNYDKNTRDFVADYYIEYSWNQKMTNSKRCSDTMINIMRQFPQLNLKASTVKTWVERRRRNTKASALSDKQMKNWK